MSLLYMDLEEKSSNNFTVLNCNVHEEDLDKREFCTWQWDDLTMENRPEERVSLSEFDSVSKEGYEKEQQTIFLVQRSPLQTIRAGTLGGNMRNYQLPYKTLLPVPLFVPSRPHTQPDLSPEEPCSKLRMTPSYGMCPEKQDITGLINNLPKIIQPAKLRVSSLISPPPKLHDTNVH